MNLYPLPYDGPDRRKVPRDSGPAWTAQARQIAADVAASNARVAALYAAAGLAS